MGVLIKEDALTPIQLSGILTTEEVKAYRRPVVWRQVLDFGLIWGQIVLGVAVYAWAPGIATYIVAALLIGGGQHGLGLIAHEFIHYNVIPGNRLLNDLIGKWLFAAPGGLPYELFRHRHFQHHRHFSTDDDPKIVYRLDIRGGRFWIEVVKILCLFEYFDHVLAVLRRMRAEALKPTAVGPSLMQALPSLAVTHAVLFLALWPIHPLAYFFLYLAPLLVVETFCLTLREITEHQPPRSHESQPGSPYFLGTSGPFVRTVGASFFERLFFLPINFGYHVEHHLWPQVSYQFLPSVHEQLRKHGVFSDPRFGLEPTLLSNIFRLARQPVAEERSWYGRPVAHDIPKTDVPVCPLCDSPQKRLLYEVNEHEYDNTTDDKFKMFECLDCTAWYLNPRPADSELETIYPPNYYSNVLDAREVTNVRKAQKGAFHRLATLLYKMRIRPIEAHLRLSPETRWLDIGCGFGMALESMRNVYGLQGVGIDMSPRAVAICRQRGFEAHAVKIEDFQPPPGTRFHFIHSSHVIEHLASPISYLEKVFELLEPGGITVFITPNTKTWESRFFGRHWGGLHVPRHWVLFNTQSALRAAQRVGFEHLETRFSSNSQFWSWSMHSKLIGLLPPKLNNALFPSDHRFIKSSLWLLARGGFFTLFEMLLNVLLLRRSANMTVFLRKPLSNKSDRPGKDVIRNPGMNMAEESDRLEVPRRR